MPSIKKDCFAYNKNQKECDAFEELFCKNDKCKFYKEKYMKQIIEADIKKYSKNKK